MVTLEGTFEIPLEDLESVLSEMDLHIQLTKSEPGCIEFNLNLIEGTENVFRVFEKFDSRESFENHQERVKSSNWGNVTTNCIRNYSINGG